VAVIVAVVIFLLGIVAAAASRLLADEFKAWIPWTVDRLIRRAVGRLPADRRERLNEEWRSHVNDVPGEVGKLAVALGTLLAAGRVRADCYGRRFDGVLSRFLEIVSYAAYLIVGYAALVVLGVAFFILAAIPLRILLPWILVIAIAALGTVISARQDRVLRMPRLYLFYVALAGSIQLIQYIQGPRAVEAYWAFELVDSFLLCLMSLELVYRLIPLVATIVSAIGACILASILTGLRQGLGASTAMIDLEINLRTLIIMGILLSGLLLSRRGWDEWPRESKRVFCGVCLLTLSGTIISAVWFSNLLGNRWIWQFFCQVSTVPGLLYLMLASRDSYSQGRINLKRQGGDPELRTEVKISPLLPDLFGEAIRKAKEEGFLLWPDVTALTTNFDEINKQESRRNPNKSHMTFTATDLANALYSGQAKRADKSSDGSGWLLDISGPSTDAILLNVCLFMPFNGPLVFTSFSPMLEPCLL